MKKTFPFIPFLLLVLASFASGAPGTIPKWDGLGGFANAIPGTDYSSSTLQCSPQLTFATLPTPSLGTTCFIQDSSSGCTANSAVTAGGGSTKCVVTWNGSNWLPAGLATSAASGGGCSGTITGSFGLATFSNGCVTTSSVCSGRDTTSVWQSVAFDGYRAGAVTVHVAGSDSAQVQCQS